MEKEFSREDRMKLQHELAAQLLVYINKEESERFTWKGTKTNLIEIVSYLYASSMACDEYGIPLSMKELTRRACERFNMSMPKSLSRFLQNINNTQGIRSHTVVEQLLCESRRRRYMTVIGIERYVA